MQTWAAVGIIAFIYLMWAVFTRRLNPLWLAIGYDGRLSTSKFQFLVWTVVALFTYLVLAAGRGGLEAVTSLPQHLMIAMGLSLSTLVAAKGVTVSYVNSGRITKQPAPQPSLDLSSLVSDDDGTPDLTKAQMLAWTAVAVATYLFNLTSHFSQYVECTQLVNGAAVCYPDIDATLMVLMGLGQGAYVGFKIADVGPPSAQTSLTSVTAIRDPQSNNVTVQIVGTGLNGASVSLDGQPLQVPVTWTDSGGSFLLPVMVNQTATTPGRSIALAANANGQNLTPVSFTVP